MQTKIIDYQNKIKTKEVNKKLKYILVGFFLLLLSIFSARFIFADIDVEFDKENYSIMEGASARVGFTVYNNYNTPINLLVFTDCDDEEEEIECNYSQRLTLPANSTQTSSFYVTGIEDTSTNLTLYVKELNTNHIRQFNIDIDITDDEEDGEFEINVYNSSLCIGKTNKLTFEINNNNSDGLYNLSLTSDRLQVNQEFSNPVYLRNEKEIDYYVYVPENTEDGEHFDLRYTIENEEITEVKTIGVYTRNCPDTYVDFTVTGPVIVSYVVNKNEEKIISYTIKNNSRNYKTIYISEEHTEEKINVNLSKRQITLSPNSSQTIDVKIKTTTDIRSGNYDLNFNFFDGINNINKKVRLMVNPEHSIEVQSLSSNTQTLVIGKNLEILLVIKNTGDIRDEFTITTTVDNDLRVRTTENTFSVYPNSNIPFAINLSAGSRTQKQYSSLNVEIRGRDSDFYKQFNYIINVVEDIPVTTLELLAYPREIYVATNSEQEINFTLKNTGNSRVTISYIEIVGVSQEVTIISPREIEIDPLETRTLKVKLNIGDLKENQENAKIRFITRNGGVLEKSIKLKLGEDPELNKDNKSGITGFLNLRNSVFTGIIVVCLAVILLFVLGIFKTKRI